MSDIGIDPSTGDLDLRTGSLVLVEDDEAVAQNLRIRLQFFLGEWFLDTRQGVPYFQKILGKKLNKPVIDQIFKNVITKTKGVKRVDSLDYSFGGATRTLSISFSATFDSGAVFVFDESFIVGAQ